MLYYVITTLYVRVCFLLLLVVLLQQGKGGDIASAFGGGSSQTAFGARGGATLLSKITAAFAALFMLGALSLAIIGQRGPASLMGGTEPPPMAPSPAVETEGSEPPAPNAVETEEPESAAPDAAETGEPESAEQPAPAPSESPQ